MTLDINNLIPASVKKAIELSERLERLAATPEILKKQAMVDNIIARSGMFSLAELKRQPKGLRGLASKSGNIQRLLLMYPPNYWQKLHNLFPEIDFLEDAEVEFISHDFFAETGAGTIEIFSEIPKIERIIASICLDNRKLYEVEPRDFEELVAELLRKKRWEVKLTKKTRDGGYDMFALQQMGGIEFKMIAEVKRWARNRKVGVDIIRNFQSVILTQGVNKGVLLTSSSFTKDAELFQKQHTPHLMDYNDLIGWIGTQKKL